MLKKYIDTSINTIIIKNITKLKNTLENTSINLGIFTLVSKEALPVNAPTDVVKQEAKKFHGSNPLIRNIEKLGVGFFRIVLKTKV
jgi:NADH/NAD ratio-sensing transcriptional regulator Rex